METWQVTRRGTLLTGLGEQGWLLRPMTAFFASRTCPVNAIQAAHWRTKVNRGRAKACEWSILFTVEYKRRRHVRPGAWRYEPAAS